MELKNAKKIFRQRESMAATGFFEVICRWSRVSCEAPRTRKCPLFTSQWQRTCLSRTKTRSLIQTTTNLSTQRCLSTSASTYVDAEARDSRISPEEFHKSSFEPADFFTSPHPKTSDTQPSTPDDQSEPLITAADDPDSTTGAAQITLRKRELRNIFKEMKAERRREAFLERRAPEAAKKRPTPENPSKLLATRDEETESKTLSDSRKLSDKEIAELRKVAKTQQKKAKEDIRRANAKIMRQLGGPAYEPSQEAQREEAAESPLSHELRSVMRTLPSAVVVLTTTSSTRHPPPQQKNENSSTPASNSGSTDDPDIRPTNKTHRGMALSSFASLTLAPDPIVTFNIRSPSRSLDALVRNRVFLLHILDADRQGARIADLFSKGIHVNPFIEGIRRGLFRIVRATVTNLNDKNEQLQITMPRLRGRGVGRVLRCEVLDTPKIRQREGGVAQPTKGMISVGDHVLVFGKVVEILDRDGNQQVEREDVYGLSYVDRKYRHVGEAIDVTERTMKPEAPEKEEKPKGKSPRRIRQRRRIFSRGNSPTSNK